MYVCLNIHDNFNIHINPRKSRDLNIYKMIKYFSPYNRAWGITVGLSYKVKSWA